ncbi:hypothetical protein FRZ06_17100 [Anoxybacterium hadale]|uniref:Uncharacterized protein n=1 Tax=Anoxybacterium hadale TaxID=3408580 RepID=A0ACD1AEI6_9FIRM|nr:hypothetical protein FRZ06_17100 [Clostridiales bacterium]
MQEMQNGETINEEVQRKRAHRYDMSGLKLVFWGLILTAINVRIQGFDIVPDPIGYIMAIIGLGRVTVYDSHFENAKKFALILLVLSLINVYQAPATDSVGSAGAFGESTASVLFSAGIFGSVPLLAMVFLLMGFACSIFFAYYICMGLKNLLSAVGDQTLAGLCDERWKLMMASEIGLMAALLLVLVGVPFGEILVMLFGALALIALILFILLIHHSNTSIHGKEVS